MLVLPSSGPSFYQLSTHRSQRGEWDFVEDWKPVSGGVVRAEWLAAAQRAIARAHAGLGLDCPILVLCSARTIRTRQWTDELYSGDAVLDADALARWSTRLGSHVTCIRIDGGMHDLLLSRAPVRRRVFAEIERWMTAYARPASRRPDPAALDVAGGQRIHRVSVPAPARQSSNPAITTNAGMHTRVVVDTTSLASGTAVR